MDDYDDIITNLERQLKVKDMIIQEKNEMIEELQHRHNNIGVK